MNPDEGTARCVDTADPCNRAPTATCRKVTGGFRSTWGADLYAAVRSVIDTAARRGMGAYQVIHATLQRQSVVAPG
jgi:transposase